MGKLDAFQEIMQTSAPLSTLTWTGVGGPIEYLARPRSEDELVAVLKACAEDEVEARALGDGSNILASDAGAPGMAIALSEEAFCRIEFNAPYVTAGAGVKLGKLATATAGEGLGGLESMVGIPGTVGAAVASNVATHDAALEQFVESVRVADYDGNIVDLTKDELVFGRRTSNLENSIVIAVKFKLYPEDAEALLKRLQKIWIVREKRRPQLEQGGFARMFKDPRGVNAADLVAESGFTGAKIGSASVCEEDPNLVVVEPGCSADDVKRLLSLIETQVRERMGVDIERELVIW